MKLLCDLMKLLFLEVNGISRCIFHSNGRGLEMHISFFRCSLTTRCFFVKSVLWIVVLLYSLWLDRDFDVKLEQRRRVPLIIMVFIFVFVRFNCNVNCNCPGLVHSDQIFQLFIKNRHENQERKEVILIYLFFTLVFLRNILLNGKVWHFLVQAVLM